MHTDHQGHSLYLIPCTLSEEQDASVIPLQVTSILNNCDSFIVENLRSARRFLRKAGFTKDFDSCGFYEFQKRGEQTGLKQFITEKILSGHIGILSESGCPGVADPGSEAVKLAHLLNIKVTPLVGPSSIILTLMASGFNGQNFCFNGYLPINKNERISRIQQMEKLVYNNNQTQLFIETPFRNNHLVTDILSACKPGTKLCIAAEITLPGEYIKTRTVTDWKKMPPIDLHKKMTVFALYK